MKKSHIFFITEVSGDHAVPSWQKMIRVHILLYYYKTAVFTVFDDILVVFLSQVGVRLLVVCHRYRAHAKSECDCMHSF